MILLRLGPVYGDYTVAAVHALSLQSLFLLTIVTIVTGCYGRLKISKPDPSRCPAYDVIISSRTQTSIMNLFASKRACAQFFLPVNAAMVFRERRSRRAHTTLLIVSGAPQERVLTPIS